ncbi:MAG: protein-glutamate O-methyltransferase CheR [Sporolactobacillus sp.]|jgi:chemotaxis protein methyltransferase CheR|nr:protein-glutamate O-methyltransferase CheR [Sporolactobacillus sp.]
MAFDPDRDYREFTKNVLRLTGIDLSLYKEAQMRRRLNTLRMRKGLPDFKSFFAKMRTSDEWLRLFLDRMTINVTEFFRNPTRWEVLEKRIAEFAEMEPHLDIWSAACSTGEEPYSLSILAGRYLSPERFTIVASDIDGEALQKAGEGRYFPEALKAISITERRRCFKQEPPFWVVNRRIRNPIRFIRHDLLRDPAPGRFNIIVCRNVLIYFTDEGKDRIYHKLSDALLPGGILFVGSTEQIFHPEAYGLRPAETFFYQKEVRAGG